MRILNSGLAKAKRLPIWTWRLEGVMLLSSLTLFGWSRMPDGKGSKPLEEKEIMVGGIEFIYVKGGTFQMGDQFGEGSDDELPVHPVRVNDFYMGKHEITFDQYDAFCEATGRNKPSDGDWGRGKRPVIYVSWRDATAFSEWLSEQTREKIRLPTEAEWEYAARERGKKVRFGNGKNIADPTEINFNASADYKQSYSVAGEYRRKTIPVGTFRPNSLGLYDMSGNVWEWCRDRYGEDYYTNSPEDNPKGPSSGSSYVYRGGSWSVLLPQLMRACVRFGTSPNSRNFGIGFRVVRNF